MIQMFSLYNKTLHSYTQPGKPKQNLVSHRVHYEQTSHTCSLPDKSTPLDGMSYAPLATAYKLGVSYSFNDFNGLWSVSPEGPSCS